MGTKFEVRYHGGACCASGIKTTLFLVIIKHIWGLPDQGPNLVMPSKPKRKHGPNEAMSYYRGSATFCPMALPQGTAGERLQRFIENIKKRRPGGIIEICLADWQLHRWRNYITNLGFKKVNEIKNSNSGSRVYVYHLNCVKES